MESSVLVQSRHLKHLRCHSWRKLALVYEQFVFLLGLTLLFARTCSAAKTTPPQRGQPCPGLALIIAVSMTVVFGAESLKNI